MKNLKIIVSAALILLMLISFASCINISKILEDFSVPMDEVTLPNLDDLMEGLTLPSIDDLLGELTDEEDLTEESDETPQSVVKDGEYDSKEEVAEYIHIYGKLPKNYIKKSDAEDLGWPGGSLEEYAPGKCIGGDRFGNYEGLLPKKSGRYYYECDIDTLGASSRGAKRIVYSNDGLIFYTEDHYETFVQLY